MSVRTPQGTSHFLPVGCHLLNRGLSRLVLPTIKVLTFFIVCFLVASSQGGIQALSRSCFSKMIPKEQANEFFGFYDIFGKFAAVMGPALFTFFTLKTESSRFGVLSILILFVIGGGIIGIGILLKFFKNEVKV